MITNERGYLIRDARPEDIDDIARIHQRMGLDYKMPNLESPLFLIQKVVERNGKVIAASALRLEAETYLWLSPDLDALDKVEAMRGMQPAIVQDAWERGLDNLVCWIPEEVEKKFRRRLKTLGWQRDREGWHSWSRPTTPDGK